METISKNNICLHLNANTWQEAIRLASKPLIDQKSISDVYVEMMINSVNELGPYIVLMPGFALAHSAPCKEVYKDDLSIGIFDKGIDFNSDKGEVYVVMVLASKDGESHVNRLSKIARKIMDTDDFINKLKSANDVNEVYDLLNE